MQYLTEKDLKEILGIETKKAKALCAQTAFLLLRSVTTGTYARTHLMSGCVNRQERKK